MIRKSTPDILTLALAGSWIMKQFPASFMVTMSGQEN